MGVLSQTLVKYSSNLKSFLEMPKEKLGKIIGLNRIVFILGFFICYSCQVAQKEDPKIQKPAKAKEIEPKSKVAGTNRIWRIPLLNDFGNIEINLPLNYDTIFRWTKSQHICGDSCASAMYRVQNARLPIYKELGSGDYWPKDSVEQFTIEYDKVRQPTSIPDSLMIIPLLKTINTLAIIYKVKKLDIDSTLYIDNNKVAVIGYNAYDPKAKVAVSILNAVTSIKGGKIEFLFERRKTSNALIADSFLKESFESLRNMRIR